MKDLIARITKADVENLLGYEVEEYSIEPIIVDGRIIGYSLRNEPVARSITFTQNIEIIKTE